MILTVVMAVLSPAFCNAAPASGVNVTPNANLSPDPACNCQASGKISLADAKKASKHRVLKGLKKEFSMEMSDLGKDLFLAFSVGGADPYQMPADPNIPYVAAEAQFVDGSASNIVKYPDKSFRVEGGFLNGTYACSQEDGNYIVFYPNGAKGKLKPLADEGYEILRPDNTVTIVTKTGSGSYRMVNDKLGYMGDITPDTTGLSYEFAKQDF